MKISSFITLLLLIGSVANARTFYKIQWKQVFSYSNAISEVAVPESLELSGFATYSDDLVFCQIILDEKRIPCEVLPNQVGLWAYFSNREYGQIVRDYSKKLDPSASRTIEIVNAHLLTETRKAKEYPNRGYEGIYVKIENFNPAARVTQMHDPSSDFESVHRRSSATMIKKY